MEAASRAEGAKERSSSVQVGEGAGRGGGSMIWEKPGTEDVSIRATHSLIG